MTVGLVAAAGWQHFPHHCRLTLAVVDLPADHHHHTQRISLLYEFVGAHAVQLRSPTNRASMGWSLPLWALLLIETSAGLETHARATASSASSLRERCALLEPRESNSWQDFDDNGNFMWRFSYKVQVPSWCVDRL